MLSGRAREVAATPAPRVIAAVGVQGENAAAVQWAAAEAAAREVPLTLVHVLPACLTLQPMAVGVWAAVAPSPREIAWDVLDRAAEAARRVAPGLSVGARIVEGPTVRALARQARGAVLLVVGGTHRRSPVRLLDRSTARRLTTLVSCPVVVVGTDRLAPARQTPPRVVVGVGRLPLDADLLRFAFLAACQRGLPLEVVHAYAGDAPADLEGVAAPDDLTRACAGPGLRAALAPWLAAYPQVAVRLDVRRGDPATVLACASRGAALTVVGHPARLAVSDRLVPPLAVRLARQARSPAAVVRTRRRPRVPGVPSDPHGRKPGALSAGS